MVYPIAKWFVFPITGLWIKKIKGMQNIPTNTGFIFAANHSSYLDHFFLGHVVIFKMNKKFHFLAKKEHFENSIERAWHNYSGAIPLDRSSDGSKVFEVAIKYLNKGNIIGMYPEGTRTLDGKMTRAKTGIARLALQAKVPVVPSGITNTFEILKKGKRIPAFKRGELRIGKPITFKKYYDKPITKKLLREITNIIMKEIAKLSGKKYKF